jgi:hypothetical protein
MKVLTSQISELKLQLEKEREHNAMAMDRTRTEIDRMRERKDREYKAHEDRLIDSVQRECNHYR